MPGTPSGAGRPCTEALMLQLQKKVQVVIWEQWDTAESWRPRLRCQRERPQRHGRHCHPRPLRAKEALIASLVCAWKTHWEALVGRRLQPLCSLREIEILQVQNKALITIVAISLSCSSSSEGARGQPETNTALTRARTAQSGADPAAARDMVTGGTGHGDVSLRAAPSPAAQPAEGNLPSTLSPLNFKGKVDFFLNI